MLNDIAQIKIPVITKHDVDSMMRGSKGLQLRDWRKKGDSGGDSTRRAVNGPEELDKAIEELFLD